MEDPDRRTRLRPRPALWASALAILILVSGLDRLMVLCVGPHDSRIEFVHGARGCSHARHGCSGERPEPGPEPAPLRDCTDYSLAGPLWRPDQPAGGPLVADAVLPDAPMAGIDAPPSVQPSPPVAPSPRPPDHLQLRASVQLLL